MLNLRKIHFIVKNHLGDVGGELALLELALVRGVEIAEWFGLVFGVETEDHENRPDLVPPWDALLPRDTPTSVCVELLLWGWKKKNIEKMK